MSEIVNEYITFMKRHSMPKGTDISEITHTLLGPLVNGIENQWGSYKIEGADYDIFIHLYKKLMTYIDMHIVERQKNVGPLVIDIDFNFDMKYKERQYSDSHIEYLIKKFNNKILKYMDVDVNMVKAFVTEKPEPSFNSDKKLYKDGFHIVYPEIPMDTKMRIYLFHIVKEEVIAENGFGDLEFTNPYEKIFDATVITSNGVLMFGSRKRECQPYSLTKIYNHDMSIDNVDNYDNDELVSVLSLRRHPDEDKVDFNEKYDTPAMHETVGKILKLYESGKKAEKNTVKDDKVREYKHVDVSEKYRKKENACDIELARKLLKILSPKRADSYDDWIHVGWACHNISDSLLDDYIEFSKKCPTKYKNGCCEKIWQQASDDGYTFASLLWWAKNDNPQEWINILREKNKHLVKEAESGTHNDIANLVHEMYKYFYKCVSIVKNVWYEFQEHYWVAIEDGYTLSEKIASDVAKEFCNLNSMYLQEASTKTDVDREYLHAQSKKMTKTYEKIRNTGFNREVLKACARKFYDSKFESQLDTKPHLFGFQNGVFDLKNGCFRHGIPDDCISMTTDYDYKEYNDDSPEVEEIKSYFNKVQPEAEMKEYVLRLISSFFDGFVKDQKFVLWTGTGCHETDTPIRMHDGMVKKVQDIKLGEYVMGADGRARHVVALYGGESRMHRVTILNDNTTFCVNGGHRLALRCHHKPCVIELPNGFFIVKYHEYLAGAPTVLEEQFNDEESAKQFITNLQYNPNFISCGSTVPVTVSMYYEMKTYEEKTGESILEYYKMYNDVTEDSNITVEPKHHDEIEEDFWGFELDCDKKYIMGNGYVTYNSNGKSTTIDLVHNTLGAYSGVLPVTVLTRKRGAAGNANPELADKKGKRFLVIQEPEHDDTVYVGQMKELVAGNDTVYARALYGNPFTYKPMFKIILICNKLPHIPSNDGGTWRRLRVTPWESIFCDKPKAKNEFKKDGELTEKMKTWGAPFAWLLLNEYYPRYSKEGLCEPDKVSKYTQQYQKDSDVYLEFLDDYVVETGCFDDSERIQFFFELFKKWYSANYSAKPPPKKEMVEYLKNKKTVKVVGDIIYGVKAKDIHGDD